MSISAYHRSILNMRTITPRLTKSALAEIDTALHLALAQINALIADSTENDRIPRSLYLAKREELLGYMGELGISIRHEISNGVESVAKEIASAREVATKALLGTRQGVFIVDFADVPRKAIETFVQRTDKEGLKISSRIWAENQFRRIEREILTAIARGESATTLAERLQRFVIGGKRTDSQTQMGMSIQAKAYRLARSEMAQVALEANRIASEESPVVAGIKWNLSNRHVVADVCNYLAEADHYGLGEGVFPAKDGALPPRPHPHCLCYFTDEIREPSEWDKPKPNNPNLRPLRQKPLGLTTHAETVQFNLYQNLVRSAQASRRAA